MAILNISDITVGQEVGYGRFIGMRGTLTSAGTSKVVKINKYGHITLENGKVFDKYGNERNAVCETHLMAPELIAEIRDRHHEQSTRNRIASEIIHKLNNRKNGFGDISELSDEFKAELIGMINRL